ncbi:hypothetical protein HK097_002801, partial [Rhizophlyctis rosea]
GEGVEFGAKWGTAFKIKWILIQPLPFTRVKHLRNTWNANKQIKVSRDGTEIETTVGQRLVQEFHEEAERVKAGDGGGACLGASLVDEENDSGQEDDGEDGDSHTTQTVSSCSGVGNAVVTTATAMGRDMVPQPHHHHHHHRHQNPYGSPPPPLPHPRYHPTMVMTANGIARTNYSPLPVDMDPYNTPHYPLSPPPPPPPQPLYYPPHHYGRAAMNQPQPQYQAHQYLARTQHEQEHPDSGYASPLSRRRFPVHEADEVVGGVVGGVVNGEQYAGMNGGC